MTVGSRKSRRTGSRPRHRPPAVLRLSRLEGLPEDADEGFLGLSLAHDEDRGHSVGLPPSTFIFQRSPIE